MDSIHMERAMMVRTSLSAAALFIAALFSGGCIGKNPIQPDPKVVYDTTIVHDTITMTDTIIDTVCSLPSDTIDVKTTPAFGTWGPNKLYRIFLSPVVPLGAKLTVLPGTQLQFLGRFNLNVEGTLECIGTATAPIIMTYGHDYQGLGKGWVGIYVYPSCGACRIAYCLIDKFDAITLRQLVDETAIEFHNNIIRHGAGGIIIDRLEKNTLRFYNNVFHHIGVQGVFQFVRMNTGVRGRVIDVFNSIIADARIVYAGNIDTLTLRMFTVASGHNCYSAITAFSESADTIPIVKMASTDLEADPQFVSVEAGKEDYHLRSKSPCIGKGISGTDMGAYSAFRNP